jgi:hypothetical protein
VVPSPSTKASSNTRRLNAVNRTPAFTHRHVLDALAHDFFAVIFPSSVTSSIAIILVLVGSPLCAQTSTRARLDFQGAWLPAAEVYLDTRHPIGAAPSIGSMTLRVRANAHAALTGA